MGLFLPNFQYVPPTGLYYITKQPENPADQAKLRGKGEKLDLFYWDYIRPQQALIGQLNGRVIS